MNIVSKITGDTLTANEFNQIPDELENLITSAGIAPNDNILTQVSSSVAQYVNDGNYYITSGTDNAIILTSTGRNIASALTNGFKIRFLANYNNSGATTINVTDFGAKSLKYLGKDLTANILKSGNYYEAIYNVSTSSFELLDNSQKIQIFNNVAELKSNEYIGAGAICKTKGYYTENDGGNAEYIIREKAVGDVDNGGSIIVLTGDTLVAELVNNGAVTVKQFGAKGDGITDDTTAIQNAISSSINNIIFTAGTYICAGIIVGSDKKIYGQKDAIIKLKANVVSGNIFKTTSSSNVLFQDLNLDGNKSNQSATITPIPNLASYDVDDIICSGIVADNTTNTRIINCSIDSCKNFGILITNSTKALIQRNNITNCGLGEHEPKFAGNGLAGLNIQYCIIDKNIIDTCSCFNLGIQFTSNFNVISYNKILNSSYIGSGNGGNHKCLIIGNHIENSVDNGLDMQQCHDIVVIGNTLYNNGNSTVSTGSKVNMFWGTDYQSVDQNAIITNNKFIKTNDFISGGGGKNNYILYSPNANLTYKPKQIIVSNNYIYGGFSGASCIQELKYANNILENTINYWTTCNDITLKGNIYKKSDLQIRGYIIGCEIFDNTFVDCGALSAGLSVDNEKHAIYLQGDDTYNVKQCVSIEHNTFEMSDNTFRVLKCDYLKSHTSTIPVCNNKFINRDIPMQTMIAYPLFKTSIPEKVLCYKNTFYLGAAYLGFAQATMQYPALMSENATDTSLVFKVPFGYTKVALMEEQMAGVSGYSKINIFEIYQDAHGYGANQPIICTKMTGIDNASFTATVNDTDNEITFTTTNTNVNEGIWLVILEHYDIL